MKKRLISLLLVVMMVCMLLPMTVLAEDAGNAGNGTVKVMVYGKAISDALLDPATDLDTMTARIKAEIQKALAGEHLPDCTFVLTNEDGDTYPLHKGSASLIESLQIDPAKTGRDAVDNGVQSLVDKIRDLLGKSISDSGLTEQMKDFYVVYETDADSIPEGSYTLKVSNINASGYTLRQPESGSVEVEVVAGKTTYAGYEKEFSSDAFIESQEALKTLKNAAQKIIDGLNKISGVNLQFPSIGIRLPGYWLNRVDPGFEFTKVDFADKALEGAEFLMVNRDETVKIVKAAVALGKETFTNAMKLIGTEGFTWEELNILNAFLTDNEDGSGKTLGLDPEEAQKLVNTYWALVEASAAEPMKDFLSVETDLRVPAILKATSAEDGLVQFTEDSNITLTWSIDILMKMANLTDEQIANAEIPEDAFENENLQAIMEVILKVAKVFSKGGTNILLAGGDAFKTFVNDWVYPVLQNDEMPAMFKTIVTALGGESAENELSLEDFLPTHGILTAKMPAGNYIMLEEKAPEGYMRNPVFYTIHLTWDTSKEDVREWCYVTVADLGIIGPYLAEDYYTFFRNNSMVSVADKIMNNVIGKDVNVLDWVLTTDDSVTATALDFWGSLIFKNMGGDDVYDSQSALNNELTQYVIKHGNNAQSLWQFAYQVAKKSRSVISSEVTADWHFYDFNDSLHSTFATAIKALLQGASDSLKSENETLVSKATQAAIAAQINIIDKVDNAVTQTTQKYVTAAKEATKKAASSALSKAVSTTKSLLSKLFSKK